MKAQKNQRCYKCGNPLEEENSADEHVLLNAIGGKLKSKDLLCEGCNSTIGGEADAELAKQLAFFSTYFPIKRDRGKTPTLKGFKSESGKDYNMQPGGRPEFGRPEIEEKKVGDEVEISASAKNEKELTTILGSLKKRFPDIDLDKWKEKYEWKEDYIDETLHFESHIGGDLAFKSILKTAINFYVLKKGSFIELKSAIDSLITEERMDMVNQFYPTKKIYKKEPKEVVHLIHLVGRKHERVLYCFIEFFSTYSFVVKLSDDYDGKNFKETYCYNILTCKELKKDVKLNFSANELKEALTTPALPSDIIKKANRAMKIGQDIQTDNEISRIVGKAVDEVFNKYKHEPLITRQMIDEFSEKVAEAYVKFALRNKKRRDIFE
ncbi:MAG: HNH endonuclease [Flavobacteriales bacterium]